MLGLPAAFKSVVDCWLGIYLSQNAIVILLFWLFIFLIGFRIVLMLGLFHPKGEDADGLNNANYLPCLVWFLHRL